MKYIGIIVICLYFAMAGVNAQSYAFGIKGGGVLASQNWSGSKRSPIITYQGDVYIETYDPDNRSFAFGVSGGYHIRGSALRFGTAIGSPVRIRSYNMEFQNIMLNVYAKQIFTLSDKWLTYYHFGVRGEYNIGRKFDTFKEDEFKPFIQRFTYGISAGGGIQYNIGELVGGFLEFSVMPDLSKQVFIPEGRGFSNPSTGTAVTIPAQSVRNFAIEVTLGIYLVHIIEYID